ncbi:MAG: hypothetical protein ACOC16_03560 [Nanoarchaeota archaeon]
MNFPLLDAYLIYPNKEKNGKIAICTNQNAPGMVLNEIDKNLRNKIPAIGSLIVTRDGVERMIVNSLAHKNIKYLILFADESNTFKPSSNLLQVIMYGYDEKQKGNFIKNGIALAHQMPNISNKYLELFKKQIIVLPIFKSNNSNDIIKKYLDYLKDKINESIYDKLIEINSKKKIYYDSLNELVKVISQNDNTQKDVIEIDLHDFQSLQPPIINLDNKDEIFDVNFEVKEDNHNKNNVRVNIDINGNYYTISYDKPFLLSYSICKFFNKNNLKLSNLDELLLGTQISRIYMKINGNFETKNIVKFNIKKDVKRKNIPVLSNIDLEPDKEFYYKLHIRDKKVCIQSLAFDTCERVFELRSDDLSSLISRINDENRFEKYDGQFIHRLDVSIELQRAIIALENNKIYMQDFYNLFAINKTNFPLIIIDGDDFLTNHKNIITSLYLNGITQNHPDSQKGSMRSGCVLTIFRDCKNSLNKLPKIYTNSTQSELEIREKYKEQLLKADAGESSYTYGSRTREHFDKDQLICGVDFLRKNPNLPFVIQRYDYVKDMNLTKEIIKDENDKIIGEKLNATHDPCLTHDIYYIYNNKLYSFHIARAHNIVNAYPENIFGLSDSYDTFIAEKLNIRKGDFMMLSNRANILLLTEEQKAKKFISQPSKPFSKIDKSFGPINVLNKFDGNNFNGLGYLEYDLSKLNFNDEKPISKVLEKLENYDGVNILQKAIDYLKLKGVGHNNPIIGTYHPKNNYINDENRLVFFQANVRANKVQATAVFINGNNDIVKDDLKLCGYIVKEYSKNLGYELGKLNIFYLPFKITRK